MGTDIERSERASDLTVFGTRGAEETIAAAMSFAEPLAKLVEEKKQFVEIPDRRSGGVNRHVYVEGWLLLGSMLQVGPHVVWTKPVPENWYEQGLPRPFGWEAMVEARRMDGTVIADAVASVGRDEKSWQYRDDYALKSMAQTRATSKALKQALGFVMDLAGFNSTPAEEMDAEQVPEQIVTPEWVSILTAQGVTETEVLTATRMAAKQQKLRVQLNNVGDLEQVPDVWREEIAKRLGKTLEPDVEDAEVVEEPEPETTTAKAGVDLYDQPGCPAHSDKADPNCEKCQGIIEGWTQQPKKAKDQAKA